MKRGLKMSVPRVTNYIGQLLQNPRDGIGIVISVDGKLDETLIQMFLLGDVNTTIVQSV